MLYLKWRRSGRLDPPPSPYVWDPPQACLPSAIRRGRVQQINVLPISWGAASILARPPRWSRPRHSLLSKCALCRALCAALAAPPSSPRTRVATSRRGAAHPHCCVAILPPAPPCPNGPVPHPCQALLHHPVIQSLLRHLDQDVLHLTPGGAERRRRCG